MTTSIEAVVTGVSRPPVGWSAIPPRMVIYVGEGALQFVCNAAVALAIARTPKLRRKEYDVIAALAVADALVGAAYLSAGLFRSRLFYIGGAHERVPIGRCYLAPHTSLLIVSQPLAAFMLVCVSIDRLTAVAKPLKYRAMGFTYSRRLIGSFAIVSLSASATLIISSFVSATGTPATAVATCGSTAAVHTPLGKQAYFEMRVVAGVTSVLLFLLVPFAYHRTMRQSIKRSSSVRTQTTVAQDERAQRRLMVTVGLSTLCTFLFYVCPNMFSVMSVWFTSGQTIREYLAIVQNLNSLFNICFYFKRHQDMREGILGLFGWKSAKTLPSLSGSRSVRNMSRK